MKVIKKKIIIKKNIHFIWNTKKLKVTNFFFGFIKRIPYDLI